MKISRYWLMPLLSVAAACGGSDTAEPPQPNGAAQFDDRSDALPGNPEIAALVYDNFYTVPDDFFVDERADTDRSYTLHHVLDASSSYELCTDDYAVAMAWEDADNASRDVQGYFVESYENARYFEFVRELAYASDIGNISDVTSPGFARVFKCSNTNRDGVDRALMSGYAGRLNSQPLDAASVRTFSEYLWQFTFFPHGRRKVIGSSGAQSADALQHTLQLAFATSQGIGRCDLIEVAEWRFTASRQTGEVSKRLDIVRSFEARTDTGTVVICD